MHGQEGAQSGRPALTAAQVQTVGGALVSAVAISAASAALTIAAQASDHASAPAIMPADDLQALFTIGWTIGLAVCVPVISALGSGRYLVASGAVFAASSLVALAARSAELLCLLRLLQGIAAGGIGPVAFIAIFTVMQDQRLMSGLALLAWALVLPANLAPILALGLSLDWHAALIGGAITGALVAAIGWHCFTRMPINRAALQADWPLLGAMAVMLVAALMIIGRGQLIIPGGQVTKVAVLLVASALIIVLVGRGSSTIDAGLLRKRRFVVPIVINVHGRLAGAALLALSVSHAGDVGSLSGVSLLSSLSAVLVGQLIGFPLAQRMRRTLDCRTVMAVGMIFSFASALWLGSFTLGTSPSGIMLPLLMQAVGHTLFVIANLQSGASQLLPAEGPTATLVFNASSMLATVAGGALAAHLLVQSQTSALIVLQQPGLLGSVALLLVMGLALLPAVLEPEAQRLPVSDAGARQ